MDFNVRWLVGSFAALHWHYTFRICSVVWVNINMLNVYFYFLDMKFTLAFKRRIYTSQRYTFVCAYVWLLYFWLLRAVAVIIWLFVLDTVCAPQQRVCAKSTYIHFLLALLTSLTKERQREIASERMNERLIHTQHILTQIDRQIQRLPNTNILAIPLLAH